MNPMDFRLTLKIIKQNQQVIHHHPPSNIHLPDHHHFGMYNHVHMPINF